MVDGGLRYSLVIPTRNEAATIGPLLSSHFNLTVELPLKAVVRGHSFKVVPTAWTNRAAGISKLCVQEMGSRYLSRRTATAQPPGDGVARR